MTTTRPPIPRRAIAAGVAAAALLGTGAATAQADSIAYVKAHNIWIAEPDGTAQHQVTRDGTADWPYRSPSQADDGTIAAAHGTDLVRLAQNGTVLSRFDPPESTDSAGQLIGGHPVHVAVSPDGRRIAYSYVHANCPPGVSCATRSVTLVSHSDRATPPETFGRVHLRDPSWAGNDRLLVFGGFLHQVNHWTPGQPAETHWFDDKDLFGIENSTDLGDGELAADRFAAVRGYGDSTHLIFYKAAGFGSAPAYACNTGDEATLDSPTWSPDGTRIAFAHKDGVEVLPLPSVEPDCPGASSGTVVLPGASEPDWGPAGVAPAPLPAPVTAVTPGQPVTPAQPGAKRACAAKPAGKARRRCRALRKCKAKPTKRARARCVRTMKRRFT